MAFAESRVGEEGTRMVPVPLTTMDGLALIEQESARLGNGGYHPDHMEGLGLDPVILQSLLETADHILAQFPPQEFDFVSLGRSGAGLALAIEKRLQQQGSLAKALELPMSGMRDDYFKPQHYEDTLRKHFNIHLSSLRERPGRKLLVFDYISGGGTLRNFTRILSMAQNEGWLPMETHVLALSEEGMGFRYIGYDVSGSSRPVIARDHFHLLELPRPFSRCFKYCAFKPFSKYRSWYFRNDDHESRAQSSRGLKIKEPRYRKATSVDKLISIGRLVEKWKGTKTYHDFDRALDQHLESEMDHNLCELSLKNG